MSARTTKQAAQTCKPVKFFDLDCSYSIDPGATLPGLVRDGRWLLTRARAVLEGMDIQKDELFGVLHLLRQADAVIGAADEMSEEQPQCAKPSGKAGPTGDAIDPARTQQAPCVSAPEPLPDVAELERLAGQAEQLRALLVAMTDRAPFAASVAQTESVRIFLSLQELAEATATMLLDDLNVAALHAACLVLGAKGGAA